MQIIQINWPAGAERVEVDLDTLSEQTQISYSDQRIDETNTEFHYNITSIVIDKGNGNFDIHLRYDEKANVHLEADDSYWGESIISFRAGQLTGQVEWLDDNFSDANGSRTFEILTSGDQRNEQRADELEIESSDRNPTDKQLLINARRGQGVFRLRVLKRESACRVTAVDNPAHLRASHIKPWNECSDAERLDGANGLMLAPHIDHLFDRGYISFDDNGNLLIRDKQVEELMGKWGINPYQSAVPARPFSERQCSYLQIHRNKFFPNFQG